MTMLFMGGEMASFSPSDGGVFERASGNVTSPSYDSSFSRCAIQCGNNTTSYAESSSWASQTALYVHFSHDISAVGTTFNVPIVSLWDGATESVRVSNTATTTYKLEYLNSSAVWTSIGTAVINGRTPFDVFVDVTNGILRMYSAGTKVLEATGLSLGHITGISKLRLEANNYSSYSQVVVSTDPTIGGRLFTVPVTGTGATSSFTGTYAEIDEVTYSDADFINSATNGQISTFAATPPALTGYAVQAVGVYARAHCGASGPQNIRMVIHVSGADYVSSADIPLDVGYAPVGTIWETNPATSAAWTNTPIATLQPGVKAVT